MASAAATFLAMTAASVAAFGVASWRAFFDGLGFTRLVVEQGGAGFEKVQSVFAAVRLLGGDVSAAYLWQALATLCALAALAALLRSGADARVKAAATIETMLLSTPYSLDYDLMALAPAMALLLSHGLEKGFRPYEKSALAFAYVVPLVARPLATALALPTGVVALVLLFASTARHALPIQESRGDAARRFGKMPGISNPLR
jgi:alpha-1,2-mannosyltransferase